MNDYFKIFKQHINKLEHPESYISMCYIMSEPENAKDLANNNQFKQLLITKKHLIINTQNPTFLIDLITTIRETENYPKSHFWWYIEKL